jgi:hypothetical protein
LDHSFNAHSHPYISIPKCKTNSFERKGRRALLELCGRHARLSLAYGDRRFCCRVGITYAPQLLEAPPAALLPLLILICLVRSTLRFSHECSPCVSARRFLDGVAAGKHLYEVFFFN